MFSVLTTHVLNAISQIHLAVLDVSFAIIKLRVKHGYRRTDYGSDLGGVGSLLAIEGNTTENRTENFSEYLGSPVGRWQ
ncbi:hypothetical protein VN97_g1034 [Penicillium thymicola]|uniref:Uncharacterized protein n=1 Tax=Penicillium thymicola TaxID=293382 RepID=A0AAI9TRQ6_PENTH|nr:hypothetical protein VN97_g1034 [Penicillium thymicola]